MTNFYGGWWQGGPQPARSRLGRLIDWLCEKWCAAGSHD